MGKIQVKFDHNLKQSDIIVKLTNSSKDESGEDYQYNQQEVQQTLVYGIQSPLIMVNNVVVDFSDVLFFDLKCDSVFPSVKMMIQDRKNLISSIDTPSLDNELRVQILPKFDQKYKKINLTFYITSFKADDSIINITGEYKIIPFLSDNIKSFGKINTYNLFEKIAKETGLGFASNVESNDIDERYVYCDNKSYHDVLSREIQYSGGTADTMQIYDYWIDWWNNLTLVDVYERYNATDSEDDMKLWVSGQNKEVTEGSQIIPIEVPAVLNNHPSNETMELFVQNYQAKNNTSSQSINGTDKVYSIYESPKTEYIDYLVQDGDVKKDIFTKYEYLGENYGEYNYLLARKKRGAFIQKMQSNETIKVTLKSPLLGLLRGNKVNFIWYINDDSVKDTLNSLSEEEMVNNVQNDIPILRELPDEESESKSNDGDFIKDESISGQYLITGQRMIFDDMEWSYILTLSRSSSLKAKIINTKDE